MVDTVDCCITVYRFGVKLLTVGLYIENFVYSALSNTFLSTISI